MGRPVEFCSTGRFVSAEWVAAVFDRPMEEVKRTRPRKTGKFVTSISSS
jgi:hypothetical protein